MLVHINQHSHRQLSHVLALSTTHSTLSCPAILDSSVVATRSRAGVSRDSTNTQPLRPSHKTKELSYENAYKKGGRMPCSSFRAQANKTLDLGLNTILSLTASTPVCT